jgi:hypothetical protein
LLGHLSTCAVVADKPFDEAKFDSLVSDLKWALTRDSPTVLEDVDDEALFTNSFKNKMLKFSFQDLQFETPLLSSINGVVSGVQKLLRGGEDGAQVVVVPSGIVTMFFDIEETTVLYNECTDKVDKGCWKVVMYLQASAWLAEVHESKTFSHLVPKESTITNMLCKAKEAFYSVLEQGCKVMRQNGKVGIITVTKEEKEHARRVMTFDPLIVSLIESLAPKGGTLSMKPLKAVRK